jgi:hypothetical protein
MTVPRKLFGYFDKETGISLAPFKMASMLKHTISTQIFVSLIKLLTD